MSSLGEKNLSFEERRNSPRTLFSMAVHYTAQGEAYEDFIHDISSGGVFIETNAHFIIGQSISITLPLPSHQHFIQVSGEVVRVTTQGIAVKFNQTIQALLSEPFLGGFI